LETVRIPFEGKQIARYLLMNRLPIRSRGRLGGLKGGKARIAQLTPEERRELARKAVRARWAKEKERKDNRSNQFHCFSATSVAHRCASTTF
jgi:hypothetical protein